MIVTLLALLFGYLVGSLPTGLTVGKIIGGVDVRTVGSHRTGATNVQRSLGTRAALAVFVLDFAKGLLPVLAVRAATGNDYAAAAAGLASVAGHVWPVFGEFRGGRGVATAAGMLAPFALPALLITTLVMAVIVALTRYVSLGSIVASMLTAVVVALLRGHLAPDADAGLMAALLAGSLVLTRHADNLHRLLHGTESKLRPKRA